MQLPRLLRFVFWFLPLFAIKVCLRAEDACPRPAVGGVVSEPEDLYSKNGILKVDLEYRGSVAEGQQRFCFVAKDGSQAPNLHVKPGDQLVLTLKNNLPASADAHAMNMHSKSPCTNKHTMTSASANLHFHGLVVAPTCHQDDTLNTAIQPSDPPYEYRFMVPADQPPGTTGITRTFTVSPKHKSWAELQAR